MARMIPTLCARCQHVPLFAGNDSHSVAGTISLASPSTGDFRVTGGTAANTIGSDGQPVGSGRAIIRLLPR